MGVEERPEVGAPVRGSRLEEVWRRDAPAGFRLAYFLTGDRFDAEELLQEAFIRVASRFGYLPVPDRFDAYLRRTIVNLFTSRLRRRRVERRWLERERASGSATSDLGERDPIQRERLWDALGSLPKRQRAALVLRYYEDLSERETADVLGCSVGAVKQLCLRGLAVLRTEPTIRDEAPDET